MARAGKHGQYSNEVAIIFAGGKKAALIKCFSGIVQRASNRSSDFKFFWADDASDPTALECREEMKGFWNRESRVYICGHGSDRKRTVAGHSPKEIASFLTYAKMPKVKTLSLAVCKAGKEINGDSFAAEFHRKGGYYLCEKLYARTSSVAFHPETGEKYTRNTDGVFLGREDKVAFLNFRGHRNRIGKAHQVARPAAQRAARARTVYDVVEWDVAPEDRTDRMPGFAELSKVL